MIALPTITLQFMPHGHIRRGRRKNTWKRDVEMKIQVQLEEDGGGSTEQSLRCRRVVCGICSTGSSKA